MKNFTNGILYFLSMTVMLGAFDSYAQQGTPDSVNNEIKKEETYHLTFSGSVDTYFHTSFRRQEDAPNTSFAQLPGFGLGMVNWIANYEGKEVGFTADLVFGPRGKDAVFANLYTSQSIINQAFVYYKLSDAITINMGQFNTFLGYEVISPAVNFHYSTSYMFSYGPFSHSGLRADIDFGGSLSAKLAVMNPADLVEFNPAGTYSFGAQIGYAREGGSIWISIMDGDQDGKLKDYDQDGDHISEGNTFHADITGGWNFTTSFYLGFNGTFRTVAHGEQWDANGNVVESVSGSKGFMGFALYPKISLSERLAVGARGEYFSVQNNYISPFLLDANGDGNVIDLTLSANYKTGRLTIIPEFRVDFTSQDSFEKVGSGGFSNHLSTFTLAGVYKF